MDCLPGGFLILCYSVAPMFKIDGQNPYLYQEFEYNGTFAEDKLIGRWRIIRIGFPEKDDLYLNPFAVSMNKIIVTKALGNFNLVSELRYYDSCYIVARVGGETESALNLESDVIEI